ncbi:MAG: glucose-1-phosphatase [Bacteroidales bacterium]|nr:glucose-1-phosphatase [Bacteroidales bacterium]
MKRLPIFLTSVLLVLSCNDRSFETPAGVSADNPYKLEQVIVLSRHNIRSPLTRNGSVLDSLTPHHDMWHIWSADAGRLTLKGGISETLMGQYFKLWLESEGLIPQDWQPSRREAYFYANSLQRTVATARHFSAGFAPAADIRVKYLPGKLNKTFLTIITADSEAFREEAARERAQFMEERLMDSLSKAYPVLEEVLDYYKSDYYKVHGKPFDGDTIEFFDMKGDESKMRGMLKTALSACDALVMQSYEEDDLSKAAFGHDIGDEGWSRLADIVTIYQDILFSAPIVSLNVSKEMADELKRELGRRGRKFTFLCGHDSTILSLLSAIGTEPYVLDNALERNTPISLKLVIERRSRDGEQFVRLRLVYPSWQQLRELPAFDLQNPPMSCDIRLKGLDVNEDGYYRLADIRNRLTEAAAAGRAADSGKLPEYLK